MDALPVDFYEKIAFFTGAWPNVLRNCGALSGYFGYVAVDHTDKQAFFILTVVNGEVQKSDRKIAPLHGPPIFLEKTSLRHIVYALVEIGDEHETEKECRNGFKFSNVMGNATIIVILDKPTISKESERLIDSIKVVGRLVISVPISKQVLRILQKVVQKKTLLSVNFKNCHYTLEMSKLLLFSLFKQDQFELAQFSSDCYLPMKHVITEWKKNSHQLVGKRLLFESNIRHELGPSFRPCTKDELSDLRRFYNIHVRLWSETFVLKSKHGTAIYGHFDDYCGDYKSLILFA